MKGIFYQNKNILEILLFITGFSIPISLAFNSISLAVLFLFSFVFYDKKVFFKTLISKEVYLYYFLFFLIQLFSVFYSKNTDLAFETIKQNVVFLIVPVTFINIKGQIDTRKFKASYFGLLSALLLTLSFSFINLFYKSYFDNLKTSNFFREGFVKEGLFNIHVPYFSLLIVFTLICSLKITFNRNPSYNKGLKIIISSILVFALFLLSGMMSLSLLLLYLLYLFYKSNLSKYLKLITVIVILIFGFFAFSYIKSDKQIERIRGSENFVYRVQKFLTSNDSVRKTNWKSVVKVVSDNPIIGVGADGGLDQLQNYRSILSEPYINKHNAHNDFLEILLRYGIIGLIIYGLLIFKLVNDAWRKKSYFFQWFLIVFIISGITESYLQRQVGLTFFTFFSLLFYNYNQKIKQ